MGKCGCVCNYWLGVCGVCGVCCVCAVCVVWCTGHNSGSTVRAGPQQWKFINYIIKEL